MGVTKYDRVDSSANFQVVSSLPATPSVYYGIASNDVDSVAWKGGEVVYHSGDSRLYIQTATSGVTATWKRLLDQFATSTSTSTSTTTSSSTSTSSTTTMA
jgi:hypothetical protein